MFTLATLLSLPALAVVRAQLAGTRSPAELAPPLTVQKCSVGGSCINQGLSVTLDASWRVPHSSGTGPDCYDTNTNLWNPTLCGTGINCAHNCALDGVDYAGWYGVATSSSAINLHFVTPGPYFRNVGSRVFLKSSASA